MKKITQIFASISIVSSLLFVPASVLALDIPSVDVTTTDVTDPTATTDPTTTSAGVPETGIAPQQSKLAQNTVVFLVGSSIGAALGVGIISARKKKTQL